MSKWRLRCAMTKGGADEKLHYPEQRPWVMTQDMKSVKQIKIIINLTTGSCNSGSTSAMRNISIDD